MGMRSYIKSLTPSFLLQWYRLLKSAKKQKEREQLKEKGQVLTPQQLLRILAEQGVTATDQVMAHSSLSKLGYVEGGAPAVVDVLMDLVGQQGTLLMPSFPGNGFNYDHLKTDPVFDVNNTPSNMGAITEDFRKRNGVLRSLHPTDPVCAFGKEAEWFVKDHFGQLTPYNEHSPFMKLVQKKGKILLLGVKLESVTNFHTPEDAIPNFKYPVYHEKVFTVRLKDKEGKNLTMITKVHDPQQSKKRRCNDLEPAFIKDGVMRKFRIGNGIGYLIDAAKMHNWLMEKYKEGITMYTPFGEGR